MHIESLQINGFGALSGEYEFSAGINIFAAANESGKTTLADAIFCLLYGARKNAGKRRLASEQEKRYRPLTGGEFSIGGVLVYGKNKRINIWRDLENDTCRILDLASGKDISSEFSRAPNGDIFGLKITGLTREQFEKLAVFSQDEMNQDWDFSTFSDSLSAIFSSESGEGGTVQKALDLLSGALNKYEGLSGKGAIKVDTEISRLQQRIAEIDNEVGELEQVVQVAEDAFSQAAEELEKNEALRLEIRENEYLACKVRIEEIEATLAKRAQAKDDIAKINAEILQLAELQELTLEREVELSGLVGVLAERESKLQILKDTLLQEQAKLDLLRGRVSELGKRSNVGEEQIREIEIEIRRLDDSERREESARIDVNSAARAMQDSGVEPAAATEFYKFLESLGSEDKDFILQYPQVNIRSEKELADLKNAKVTADATVSEIIAAREYAAKSSRNHIVYSCILTAASIVAFFMLNFLSFLLLPVIFSILWGGYGVYRLSTSQKLQSEELNEAVTAFESADSELVELKELVAINKVRVERLAEISEIELADFFETVNKMNSARDEVYAWRHVKERLEELTATRDEALASLHRIFVDLGVASKDTVIDAARSRVFLREIEEAFSVVKQEKDLSESLVKLTEDNKQFVSEVEAAKESLVAIAGTAGIEQTLPPEKILEQYRELVAKKQRYEYLKNSSLPTARQSAGDEKSYLDLSNDLKALEQRSASLISKHPHLETLSPDKTIADYESLINLHREKLQGGEGAVAERERALAISTTRVREELPGLRLERERCEAALNKAIVFQQAVTTAEEVFAEISTELHSRWSPALSSEYNETMKKFSGGWRFTLSRDLTLGAVKESGGEPLDEEGVGRYLSRGMRDQAYLALRLLLAGKISQGEPLPLILDDPFVNADDERFVEGMEQLKSLAVDNQIFVFSCHESRHDELAKKNIEFSVSRI